MKIEEISDKLVELYGKWIKINADLGELTNVEAKPINNADSRESTESSEVPPSKRPDK